MKTVQRYSHPADLGSALALKAGDPEAVWLAGGTSLLSGDYADKPEAVIDVGAFIPSGISVDKDVVRVGAGTTLQVLADAAQIPAVLRDAAGGLGSRNVRNRATVGGNIGADRACSLLMPSLLALGTSVEVAELRGTATETRRLDLAVWLAEPAGLILALLLPVAGGERRASYGRWARTSCDAALLSAALSFTVDKGKIKDLRLAMGGIELKSRRIAALEKRFEGWPLTQGAARDAIEEAALPLLAPADFGTLSVAFRRLRGAALLADVLSVAAGGAADAGGRR